MFDLRIMNDQTEGIEVDENTDLLSSLRAAGQDPICDCGGDGKCGKCKARIVAGNITDITDVERELLTPMELGSGWFLMCQRKPLEDLIIDMPQRDGMNFVLAEENLEVPFVPAVQKTVLDFAEINVSEYADYNSMLLAHFNDMGVNSVSAAALEQLIPAKEKGNGKVTVVHSDQIMTIEPGDTKDVYYGLACDLGTATIGLEIVDVANRRRLGKAYIGNSQRSFGYDVEHRVQYVKNNGGDCSELTKVLHYNINKLITQLCEKTGVDPNHIYNLEFVGNPQLTHLLFGVAPMSADETPVFLNSSAKNAKDVGINVNPMARVKAVDALSAELGGDQAVIANAIKDNQTLVVDLGIDTNLILKKDGVEKMKKISTPVFEGMGLQMGMINGSGSITGYFFDEPSANAFPKTFDYFTAKGISGMGFFTLYHDLKALGYLNEADCFDTDNMPENVVKKVSDGPFGRQMVLFGGGFMSVVLTEKDVHAFTDTVAALQNAVADFTDGVAVDKIIFTGAVGGCLDLAAAEEVGLLPDNLSWEKAEFVPEMALNGAERLLFEDYQD